MTGISDKIACVRQLLWRIAYPLLIYVAIGMLVSIVVSIWYETGGKTESENAVLISMLISAAITAVVLGKLYHKEIMTVKVPLHLTASSVFLIVMLGAGSCVFLNHIIVIFKISSAAYERVSTVLYTPPFYLQLLAVGIVIPFTEELVFRGFGFYQLRQLLTFPWAALLSALYFSLYHGNVVQGIYAFLLGLLMAWLCECYHSLKASVCFHISANLCSVLLTRFSVDSGRAILPVWLVLLISAGLSLLGIYKIREDVKKHEIIIHSNSML